MLVNVRYACLLLHCNTLQHTATHCNTLQHTAIHCDTVQHAAIRCNTLQHTATHCNTLQHAATRCNTLQHAATRCNTRTPWRQCGLRVRLSLRVQLMSHMWMRDMSHTLMSHLTKVSFAKEPYKRDAIVPIHKTFVSQIGMSHFTNLNESCHTCG